MIKKYNQIFEKNIEPKIGDMVICIGDIDGLKTHNHIGILKNNGIQFINRFSNRLHDLDGSLKINNGWFIKDSSWTKKFNDNKNKNNIPLVYSDDFKKIISYNLKFLLDYEKIFYCDISYIDITNRIDTITFLSARDFYKLEENENPWDSTMRQSMRFGRFIKKIIDDQNNIIENYVNEYKFSLKLSKDDFGRFKITKGINMSRWYLEINYADGGGNLRTSCMRHLKSQRRLPIYTSNPEKIRLLYILDSMGKLMGRALLWKLDTPFNKIYMDRIYYTEEYIEKLFLDYANKKGYLTKDIVDRDRMLLKVYLNRDYGQPRNNPFMDTFKFFVKNGNYLTNRFLNFKPQDYWEYVDHD